jgi:hypothetical protein
MPVSAWLPGYLFSDAVYGSFTSDFKAFGLRAIRMQTSSARRERAAARSVGNRFDPQAAALLAEARPSGTANRPIGRSIARLGSPGKGFPGSIELLVSLAIDRPRSIARPPRS